MTDTDLIVPVEVHALLATRDVANFDDFRRWSPRYPWTFSKDFRSNAEPPIQHSEGNPEEGIHVQWQLPEALATGVIDPATGVSTFPLVPNRWLVVRYAEVRGVMKAAGFLVHSDYLEKADGGPVESAFTPFVDPNPDRPPRADYIGRVHPLTAGRWSEPADRPLFLTAIGSGLPAFAAFAPYHENVFLFHDTLADLKASESYPPPCTVSYCVIGWYSKDSADILKTARDLKGLLPPTPTPTTWPTCCAPWAGPPPTACPPRLPAPATSAPPSASRGTARADTRTRTAPRPATSRSRSGTARPMPSPHSSTTRPPAPSSPTRSAPCSTATPMVSTAPTGRTPWTSSPAAPGSAATTAAPPGTSSTGPAKPPTPRPRHPDSRTGSPPSTRPRTTTTRPATNSPPRNGGCGHCGGCATCPRSADPSTTPSTSGPGTRRSTRPARA